ncbi:MAG: hypothetical protein C0501_10990 [Isosphaera sp.]|nr:hypothetical protein [Isosphaera sp.]
MRRTLLASAFLVLGAAAAADPTGLPGPPAEVSVNAYKRLVNHPAVAKELGLDAKKAKAAFDLGLETSKKYTAGMAALGRVPGPERTKKKAELREATELEYRAGLAKLLTPAQLRRLGQVRVQAEGVAAFAWPEVAGPLKLTDAQKAQVGKITKDMDAARSTIIRTDLPTTGVDAEKAKAMSAKIYEVQRKAAADAVGLLDAAQKKVWKDLAGEPFDVSKLDFGADPKD